MPSRRNNNSRSHGRARARNEQNENRSILLQDFLNGRYPNIQLSDIVSHVCEFARDRDGSKLIQMKLDEASAHRKCAIYQELKSHLFELMTDRFANFIIQKYIEIGNVEQRQDIFILIQMYFLGLSQHKYGCRVVQRAIERATIYEQYVFQQQQFFGPSIIQLARDANGNHVVQTFFRSVIDSIQTNLYTHIHPYVIELSYHSHGCRVIQCILEHGNDELRFHIFNQIRFDLLKMIQDRCGNYVIQNAIQYCSPNLQNYLIEFVLKDVVFLSVHKYSSNVVEKCITLANPLQQIQTMDLVCSKNERWLKCFCVDKFANYVVQKLIEVVGMTQLSVLYSKLEPYFNEIERHVCGRKIVNRLRERINEFQHAFERHFQQLYISDELTI